MADKRTMTLNLTEAEMDSLERLSLAKDMNKTALVKQALRLYTAIDERIKRGEKIFFEDELKKDKAELVVL